MRIMGICGSLQAGSQNRALLVTAAKVLGGRALFEINDQWNELPPYNPELECEGAAPSSVTAWRGALARCDALLVACPEYGFSLPGALKNAIDWVIGSGELERKLVAVTASVAGPGRGQKGLDALCGTLAAVSAQMVGGVPIVRGANAERHVAELIEQLLARAV